MKIVHCIYSFNTGGAESMLIDILNEQCKTENISLIIINASYADYMLEKIDSRVDIIRINRREHSKSIIPILKLNLILYHIAPEVIHLHNESLARLIWLHKKIFFTAHCLNLNIKNFSRFYRIIAISDAVMSDILSRGKFPVVTIQNGIRVEDICTRPKKDKGIPFKIIQVGRLDKNSKGQDILINALDILVKKGFEDISVDFIGEGISFDELKELVNRKNLSKFINFLGLKDRDYVYSHLKDYDLMCHPSRNEGFGLVIAEGMAAKLPVLVSSDDGPFEVIGKGKYGCYFIRENVFSCAQEIERIYNNYMQVLEIVDEAREYVIKTYSVKEMVHKYLNEYTN